VSSFIFPQRVLFCLSSIHLLDRTIFRDADDTSGHAGKENISHAKKPLLLHQRKRQPNTIKTGKSLHFQRQIPLMNVVESAH